MILKQFKLSQQAKEQLIRLKSKTGIEHWNVLCRWALCMSLREPSQPPDMEIPADSNVEMSWLVFGGEYHEVYEALVIQRCLQDGLGTDQATLAKQFRLHLHRGIGYLAATGFITSIKDLVSLAVNEPDNAISGEA